MKIVVYFILPCLFLATTVVYGQDGTLDNTFANGDGYELFMHYPNQHTFGHDIAITHEGKILVTSATNTSGFAEAVLMQLLPDGSLDNTFNGSGRLYLTYPNNGLSAEATVIQPDNKIVTIVHMTNNNSTDSLALFRFYPDGLPDNTFSGDGIAISSFGYDYHSVNALELQGDGKFVVCGYVGNAIDTFDQFFIARFLPNGEPDPSFDQDGISVVHPGETWTSLRDLIIQPDGKYVVAGYSTTNDQEDMTVLRVTANGTPDPSFSGDGIVVLPFSNTNNDDATGLVLQPDGKIVISGTASINSNDVGFAIARLTTDGNLDPDFHGDGMNLIQVTPGYDRSYHIIMQPDGRFIIAGSSTPEINANSRMTLLRLMPNGLPDPTFDQDGIVSTVLPTGESEIYKVTFDADGKLVIVGSSFNARRSLVVARYNTGITVSNHDDVIMVDDIQAYPNPFINQFTIRYTLLTSQTLTINISDAQGRMVQQLMPATSMQAGRHEATFQRLNNLAPGQYFLNVSTGAQVKTIGIVVQ